MAQKWALSSVVSTEYPPSLSGSRYYCSRLSGYISDLPPCSDLAPFHMQVRTSPRTFYPGITCDLINVPQPCHMCLDRFVCASLTV